MDREHWITTLNDAESKLGFTQGYKFVYGPWETLNTTQVAFLSLNPGRAPDSAEMRTISDERGNSYEVEQWETKSRITSQFLLLANFLERKPLDILTGVVVPFRSDSWDELSKLQKSESLSLGQNFWEQSLSRPELRTIIACSNEAAKFVNKIVGASFDCEASINWADYKIRRYRSQEGKVVIHLPHLSRFPIIEREKSMPAVRSMFEGV